MQQTKEDLNLSNDTDTLREQLDALRTYVENGGVYQAECSGVIWSDQLWQQEARP